MDPVMTLDKGGIVSALALGVLILYFGQSYGIFMLLDIFWFLLLAYFVTEYKKGVKKKLGFYERYRTWKNVVANGMMPLVAAVLFYFSNGVMARIFLLGYVASVSAVTADKFASEVGILGGQPTMLLTMRKVKKGTSGGVTRLGLISSMIGAVLTSVPVFFLGMGIEFVVLVALSGFIGNIFDSVLGYFEEQHYGNKFTSNAGCALVGFVVCIIVAALMLNAVVI